MISADIAAAAARLRNGELVAFPTETVYGLGADASNAVAVRKIFAAKGRPVDHPLIVHLASSDQLGDWAAEIPDAAARLAKAFWPGPMTLILRRNSHVPDEVTGGLPTIGLRVPSHPVAQELLRAFGGGVAAPSANRFGRISPTRAEHVAAEALEGVDCILEGGDCEVGLESTIIDLSRGRPAILRPGAITAEQVEEALSLRMSELDEPAPRVSGSLESHYAPRAAVEIVASADLIGRHQQLTAEQKTPLVIAAGATPFPRMIAAPDEPAAFARRLYDMLREADHAGADVILVVPPPEIGIGVAVWDRLRKAAAPR